MPKVNPLTQHMREFRECARHVWNSYFLHHEDGWHEFPPVERALFSALVLSRLGVPEGQWTRHPDGYYPAISVVPDIPPRGLPIMHADAKPSPAPPVVDWAEASPTSQGVDLRYVGFFDFANLDDPMDFRYVRVRALRAESPELVGRDMLIEMPHVVFERRDR